MICISLIPSISKFPLFTFLILISLNTNSYSQNSSRSWKFENTPEWSDEFNYDGLPDSSKWTFESGDDGWGNNELQYYTIGDNAIVKNGVLKIIAEKSGNKNYTYTSSRMITRDKAYWNYGRIEIKARLPAGRGTWSAFWMLPQSYSYGRNISSGEIDIMEHVGFEQDVVHFSVHTKAYNSYKKNEKTNSKIIPSPENRFCIYSMDWTPQGIRGYVDGIKYFEYLNNNKGFKYWPFDKNFFLIINLAVGGDWGGLHGIDNNIFPATMEIDYVRVYKFLE